MDERAIVAQFQKVFNERKVVVISLAMSVTDVPEIKSVDNFRIRHSLVAEFVESTHKLLYELGALTHRAVFNDLRTADMADVAIFMGHVESLMDEVARIC